MSFEQFLKKLKVMEDFSNPRCLLISLKTLNLKTVIVDFEPVHQRHELFLFTKPTEHFSLMVSNGYNIFPFCAEVFLVLLNDISGIFSFIHFLGSFVQLFCFSCVIVYERIYQLLFHFFFIESLRLFNVFKL